MAESGNGQGLDISMKAGGQLKTTTSQYCVVGMGANTTTADWTAYLANNATTLSDTQTAYHAIGINQTYMSANSSESVNIRWHGISKVICASTVAAGDIICAYDGISTSTHPGHVISQSLKDETNVTCAAYGVSVAVQYVMLGRALEDGVTNSVITAFINCTPYERSLWAHT